MSRRRAPTALALDPVERRLEEGGLAIAERAVRVHGGSVPAENADGGGLAVTIELPIASSAAAG